MSDRALGRVWITIAATLLLFGCAEPPNREIDQAQGALDAARAAGAEQYAAEEFAAAVTSLKQSRAAVAARDYRSALNYALDSRERAQIAAKQASNQRAVVRSQVEHALAEIAALLDRGDRRLAIAESGRAPRRTITRVSAVFAGARTALQKAGAAVERGEYAAAQRQLDGVQERVAAALKEIDTFIAARPGRPRR